MNETNPDPRPVPVPDEITEPYWDAAREQRLVIQRCAGCRRFHHPPLAACPQCVSGALAFEPVSGRGSIYAYTIMREERVRGFEGRIPYVNVVVELAEQPLLLLVANLIGGEQPGLRIGAAVEVVFEKRSERVTVPQFRLVKQMKRA